MNVCVPIPDAARPLARRLIAETLGTAHHVRADAYSLGTDTYRAESDGEVGYWTDALARLDAGEPTITVPLSRAGTGEILSGWGFQFEHFGEAFERANTSAERRAVLARVDAFTALIRAAQGACDDALEAMAG